MVFWIRKKSLCVYFVCVCLYGRKRQQHNSFTFFPLSLLQYGFVSEETYLVLSVKGERMRVGRKWMRRTKKESYQKRTFESFLWLTSMRIINTRKKERNFFPFLSLSCLLNLPLQNFLFLSYFSPLFSSFLRFHWNLISKAVFDLSNHRKLWTFFK